MPPPSMAAPGIITSQTDTVNIKRDISEAINFLSPFDTPFLDLVGRDSLKTLATQIRHEWLEDQLKPRAGTLLTAHVANDGQIALASGEGKYLYPGDVILVQTTSGQVWYRINGNVPDTDLALVSVLRSDQASDADLAFAAGSIWRKVAHAAQEGGSARNDASKTMIANPYNFTQIMKDWIIITGTMEVIDRYGYANERAYQEMKALRSLAIDLEYALLYGPRYYTAGPPRVSTMGGLAEFVLIPGIRNAWSTVVDLNGIRLLESHVGNLLQALFDNGGNPDFIMVNGTNKRIVTEWATPRIRTEQSMRTAGASIGVYESDFGRQDIILNRWLRPSDVIIGSRGMMGIGPLTNRQFTSRLLPSTIDGTWFELLGEYTMEVHKPTLAWGWIFDTATVF